MLYHAKESTVALETGTMPYISFGGGEKTLVIIPGLRTSGIEGSAMVAGVAILICLAGGFFRKKQKKA